MAYKAIQIDESPANVLCGGKAGVALSCGALVSLDASGVWQKADALPIETATASRLDAQGVVTADVQANEFFAPVRVARLRDTAGSLTVGAKLYLSATAGALTETRPALTGIIQEVGFVYKTDEILVNCIPTPDKVGDMRVVSTDATAHGSTASGRLGVVVGGVTKYIHVYTD